MIYASNWLLRRIIAKQLFVYKTLFTLIGHMTLFCLQKSCQELYKAIYAFKKGLQGDFWVKRRLQQLQQFKSYELQLILKCEINIYYRIFSLIVASI